MQGTTEKRKCATRIGCACLSALLFLVFCIPFVRAEGDLQTAFGQEDAPAIELEDSLAFFAAMDVDTGALLATKQAEAPFSATGGAVTMMTALLAKESLDPEQKLSTEWGEVRVEDLLAGMLLEGDQACAEALAQAALGEDPIPQMKEKALALSMTATTYTNPTGREEEGQRTTCTDLLRLARALLESEIPLELLSCPVWETKSPESEFPEKLENRVLLFNPDSALYDDRVLAAFGGGNGEEYFNTVILAQAGDQRVLLACAAEADEEETYELLSGALDALEAGCTRVDVTDVARAALDATVASISEYTLQYSFPASLQISARMGWTLQENALRIELQNIRPEPAVQELYADALVLVDGREIARVPLTVQAKREDPETPEETTLPAETPEPNYAQPSVAPEDLYQPTAYDRYGWAAWIAAGLAGAVAVLVILGWINRKIT
jgi:hypothetical protein